MFDDLQFLAKLQNNGGGQSRDFERRDILKNTNKDDADTTVNE